MAGIVQVSRLRVSYVAGCIHDGLQEIGEPVEFAQRLADPAPVRGLPVTLPFGRGLDVDTTFWTRIAERRLTAPVPADAAAKLRRAAIPLRCGGKLQVAAEVPRLEAHLHPFGVVAMATVDLAWPQPAPLDAAAQPVQRLEDEPATVTIGAVRRETTLGRAAGDAADAVIGLLTDAGSGQPFSLSPHRLVTVISGTVDEAPATMPAPNSPLHLAMHQLSVGDTVVAEPATAFVAQWSGAGYAWPPNRLLYMLDRGTTLLSAEATAPAGQGTSDRHRWLLLLTAYLSATTGLVRAAEGSTSVLFPEWAATAAKRLGLLFGPGRGFLDWGLVPRALLQRTGASQDVARLLGAPLVPNPDYPVPDYG